MLQIPKILLVRKCERPGLLIQRSRAGHENTRQGLFSCRNFAKRDVMGYYYGSLAYANFGREL